MSAEDIGNQTWRTPPWLFKKLEKEIVGGRFLLDAAASKENAMCKRFFTEKDDGLTKKWAARTFINPGYAQFGKWIAEAVRQARDNDITVCLIGPKGCSQRWFHEYAKQGTIYAPDRRIVFFHHTTGKPTAGAREDSMIYVVGSGFWNPVTKPGQFEYRAFSVEGLVETSRSSR